MIYAKSCCCISLRTGVIIIGIFDIVSMLLLPDIQVLCADSITINRWGAIANMYLSTKQKAYRNCIEYGSCTCDIVAFGSYLRQRMQVCTRDTSSKAAIFLSVALTYFIFSEQSPDRKIEKVGVICGSLHSKVNDEVKY